MDEELVRRAVDLVEALCTPDKMPKTDAVEFLGAVIAQLDSSIEALQEEIENEGG